MYCVILNLVQDLLRMLNLIDAETNYPIDRDREHDTLTDNKNILFV
jgi:hypothetical protein